MRWYNMPKFALLLFSCLYIISNTAWGACNCHNKVTQTKVVQAVPGSPNLSSKSQKESLYIRPISDWKYPRDTNNTKASPMIYSDNDSILKFQCPITHQIWDIRPKPQIYKTNNLFRRVGSATYADGNQILIRGRLLDARCVPIANAVIEIYQADSRGNYFEESLPRSTDKSAGSKYLSQNNLYTHGPISLDVDHESDSASGLSTSGPFFDSNFTGSGSAVTDNLGNFVFYTIIPGGIPPKIKFYIKHSEFSLFETYMFFESMNNDADANYRQASEYEQTTLLAKFDRDASEQSKRNIYSFDIVLNGQSIHRTYS